MMLSDGTSGSFAEGCHIITQRVYYEHTDSGGVVYHGTYLRFVDRARTELLRVLGIENSELQSKHGIVIAVRSCCLDFVKPARLDDLLTVCTSPRRLGGATLDLQQIVRRDGEDLARVEIRLACMTLGGRAARIPVGVRERLADPRLTPVGD